MRARRRRLLARVAWLAVAVAGVVAGTESLVRLSARLFPGLLRATATTGRVVFLRGIVRVDPGVGYDLAPGYVGAGGPPASPITIRVSSLGFRDREYDLEGADARRRFVLAAGDSFSFGSSVELRDTFPSRLEAMLGAIDPSIAVVKAGVPGYSVVQSVATALRYLDRFAPELVVVQLIPQTEERNLYPQQVMAGGLIIPRKEWHYYARADTVFDSPFAPGVLASLDVEAQRFSHAYRAGRSIVTARLAPEEPLTADERRLARDRGVEALAALDRRLRSRGGRVLVVLNNWAQSSGAGWESVTEGNRAYEHALRERDVEVLDTMPRLRAESERVGYLGVSPANRHWNATGHALAAMEIEQAIRMRGLLGGVAEPARGSPRRSGPTAARH